MSTSYYKSLSVQELKEILIEDGATNLSKCNKEELISRLILRERNPNRQETLFQVQLVAPEADHSFPSAGFKELSSFEMKILSSFSEDSMQKWFKKRQGISSLKKGRHLAIRKFVKCIQILTKDKVIFVKAFCAAQTTKSVDYDVQLIIEDSKKIVQATCQCPAGEGWSASCKHVAAVCYNIEHFGLCGDSMELVSKTSQPQQWGKPKPGRQVGIMTADQISQVETVPRHIKTSREEMLRTILKEAEPSSPLFCTPSWHSKPAEEAGDADNFEMQTRGQGSNEKWRSARKKMITGSIVYEIIRTVEAGNFSKGPAYRQINPSDLSNVPAIKWGRDHEKVALSQYEKIFQMPTKECGLFIKKELDYFGASPDALSGDGKTVIEIKCPYNTRFQSPKKSCYVSDEGALLKKEYYAQVQAQMLVTGKKNVIS